MPLTQVQGGMILPSTTLTTPIVATTMSVGGATPAAAGTGITFPATQSASSDANTLDDYEEGTWTPTIGNFTLNSGTFSGTGTYTKIGRQVTINFRQSSGNITWATGAYLSGLPFTPPDGQQAAGSYTNGSPNVQGNTLIWSDGNIYFASGQSGQGSITLTATYQI